MATLRLRNCTKFTLKYWRSIAFHRTSYITPGMEGTYDWFATYTLKAARSNESPDGEHARYAVNPDGIYYAYWRNNTVDILDEDQIKDVTDNEDNPYIERWISPPVETHTFPVTWQLVSSCQNSTGSKQDFVYKENYGFSVSHTASRRLNVAVNTSAELGINNGAEFEVKSVKLSGIHEKNVSHEKETFEETMTEDMLYKYQDNEYTLSVPLNPGESIAVWQAQVNIWGNRLDLDYLAFTKANEGSPEFPKFDPVKVEMLVWK